MATKGVSSRAGICGRGGGGSAVDMAAYISRTKMFSEYDGEYHIPKYKEDLVHCEVMLPDHAPRRYLDPEVLWNSVEMNEKTANAQCARTLRMSLPNDWPHELAVKVARDYIRRNFIKKGMCVFFAIHDSVNPETGERNLHIHIMMTMRGIDENGKWMPKQKKVYLTDENGDRTPMIDKKTGQQKVDKQNRKQWKCTTVSTNDWNNRMDRGRSILIRCGNLLLLRLWSITKKTLTGCWKMRAISVLLKRTGIGKQGVNEF